MKILLVVYDNASYVHFFPQGVAYIAAILKKEGHDVTIYNQDINHYPDEYLTTYLNNNHYDAIGISVIAGYYQYQKLLKLSKAIDDSTDKPLYILGGHGPSPDPEYFLRKTKADIVVIGEGEETIIELLKRDCSKDVKGVAYIDGEDKFIRTERRPLIQDIDAIPYPAYELFPIEHYRLLRMPRLTSTDFCMPILSGRGCIYKCTFCYRMDEGHRPRKSQSIIEEIKFLKEKYRMTVADFSDELLMSSVPRTIELCEAIIDSKINVRWHCNGRLNFATAKVLKLMKRAGCIFINYGIEALDNEVLKTMKKGLTVDIITKGIEETLKVKISPGLNIMWGNIGDNEETLERAVNFLIKYDDCAQLRTIRPVTPYPGSELYYTAIKKGLLKDCADFYENKHSNSDLVAINFTNLKIDKMHELLLKANTTIINNYYNKHAGYMIEQAKKLYLSHNTKFRGYRQY